MAWRQEGMEVGGFAQTFWTLAVGLNYNDAALKDLLNICLDNPLPQWEVKGLEILDFWGFVRYLQGRSQWAKPGQSETFCRGFPTTSILQTPTKRRRGRRKTGKPTPEPAPFREPTEPAVTKLSLLLFLGTPELLRGFSVPPMLPDRIPAPPWLPAWVLVWQEPHWLIPPAPSWLSAGGSCMVGALLVRPAGPTLAFHPARSALTPWSTSVP
ncbi:uncharacterized protein LOC107709969 [Sinocyclocheilus rhinocerous]|uniref:uncharacterized protein LOC107709969 n=1 Tax=Sinocyclocheilus rhinocerous TaxID=307959 RepID=UPI0007B7EFAB|nr:PREDICTED: uncharacterized protein LOC107709969 [Sinocyclocheilus rhinocerous]